jgi:hypothetical protein
MTLSQQGYIFIKFTVIKNVLLDIFLNSSAIFKLYVSLNQYDIDSM